jgi:hypothetical protein
MISSLHLGTGSVVIGAERENPTRHGPNPELADTSGPLADSRFALERLHRSLTRPLSSRFLSVSLQEQRCYPQADLLRGSSRRGPTHLPSNDAVTPPVPSPELGKHACASGGPWHTRRRPLTTRTPSTLVDYPSRPEGCRTSAGPLVEAGALERASSGPIRDEVVYETGPRRDPWQFRRSRARRVAG